MHVVYIIREESGMHLLVRKGDALEPGAVEDRADGPARRLDLGQRRERAVSSHVEGREKAVVEAGMRRFWTDFQRLD